MSGWVGGLLREVAGFRVRVRVRVGVSVSIRVGVSVSIRVGVSVSISISIRISIGLGLGLGLGLLPSLHASMRQRMHVENAADSEPGGPQITVIGAGLAGSECAWQLAERGFSVELIEQKPFARSAAQKGDGLAELVCSNSFRGAALANAVGLLKEEMRRAGSLIMAVAEVAEVPAGGALAVDRDHFSATVTERIEAHPRIDLVRREILAIPELDRPVVLATGPLTGDALAADLAAAVGQDHLAYYDAIAPVVTAESVNWDVAFMKSRYDKGGDAAYGNCPLDKEQYEAFVQALIDADKVVPHEFEQARYFEGCLPVDVMAERGVQTLAFGPMKPVGLEDPRTGVRPHAVVQLRQEDRHGTAFNLVGFQTRLKWPDQKRVLRMIPGLENAEFERLGSVHRNTYVDSPRVLDDDLALKARPGVYLAGQVSGVEGYLESAAGGLVLATMLARKMRGEARLLPPETTALGGLLRHLRDEKKDFAPSNVVWSMMPPLPGRKIRKRRLRREALAARALVDLEPWLLAVGVQRPPPEAEAPEPAPPDDADADAEADAAADADAEAAAEAAAAAAADAAAEAEADADAAAAAAAAAAADAEADLPKEAAVRASTEPVA